MRMRLVNFETASENNEIIIVRLLTLEKPAFRRLKSI